MAVRDMMNLSILSSRSRLSAATGSSRPRITPAPFTLGSDLESDDCGSYREKAKARGRGLLAGNNDVHQSARHYATLVDKLWKRTPAMSLYCCPQYMELARFLREVYHPSDIAALTQQVEFVTLYDLDPRSRLKRQYFKDPDQLYSYEAKKRPDHSTGQLLFLRGYPSPLWLSALGAKYCIDPEFYQRHLEFFATVGADDFFPYPSMPSSSANIIRIRLTTLARGLPPWLSRKGDSIETIRTRCDEKMREYDERVRKHEINLGDSIVRKFYVHDKEYFSFEQDLSICVQRSAVGKGWTAIMWLDNGNDLMEGPEGPWRPPNGQQHSWSETKFYPVIQPVPNLFLNLRDYFDTSPSSATTPAKSRSLKNQELIQSSSRLHIEYGQTLDRITKAVDAFYTLSEIFRWQVHQETQFINFLKTRIDQENINPQVENLQYTAQILDAHSQYIQDSLASIRTRGHRKWPRATLPGETAKVDNAARRLETDMLALGELIRALRNRCDAGISNINMSKKAVRRTELIAKIGYVAALFIPLNSIIGFFGMNFTQLGSGKLHIWVFFVVAIPTFAIFIMVLYLPSLIRRFRGGQAQLRRGW